MKAAVFYGKGDLRIEEKAIPTPKAGELLVRVRACGICGTDAHIFDGDEGAAPTPSGTVLGHEFAGEVQAIGEGVQGFSVGDRVCVDPNLLCGGCEYCLGGIGHFCENMVGTGTTEDGGFAEYCVVKAAQAHRFSKELSFEHGAMTEPLACCLHGIDMCDIKAGDTVAIIGGGMIGLLMLQLARLMGAARVAVVEPLAEKRRIAEEIGAALTVDPTAEDVKAALENALFGRISTVIECVGKASTMELAVDIAGNKSTVMLFGLTRPDEEMRIKPFELFKKEISLKASFINPYTQKRALSLIESGRVDVGRLIHATATLDELPSILAEKRQRVGKHLITM